MKLLSQSPKGFLVSFEIGVEMTGQLEDKETLGFDDSRKLAKVLERVAGGDVLENNGRVGEVD